MPAASSPQRLEACLPYIFEGEGGFTANPKDPGNWTGGKVGVGRLVGTKYGIAAHANPGVDIKNLTVAKAADIYRAKYWTTAGCDQLPPGPDLPIFDVSVNSGPGRARTFAKATANLLDSVARIKAISVKRRSFYRGLSTFKTFGKGWLARVSKIEAAAIKMALMATGANPVIVKKTLQAEAVISEKKQKQTGAVAGAGAAAPVGTVAGTESFDWVSLGIAGAVLVVVGLIAYHFLKVHMERSKAMVAEAEAT